MFQGRNAHDGDGKNQGERSAVAFGAVQCDHHGAYIVQMIPANTIARDNRAVPALTGQEATFRSRLDPRCENTTVLDS